MNTRTLLLPAFLFLLASALELPKSIPQHGVAAREPAPFSATIRYAYAKNPVRPRIASVVVQKPTDAVLDLLAKQPDLLPQHRQIATDVLRMLPAQCLPKLKNFYVRYDNPSERGLAGKSTVILSGNVSNNEFRALLVHEVLGHVMDLGCLEGTAQAGESTFRDGDESIFRNDPSVLFYRISWDSTQRKQADAMRGDFVSGYAYEADPFEDMAESVTFYALHQEEFRRIAATNPKLRMKLTWIEAYVFPNGYGHTASTFVWDSNDIPWDTTKLPYQWIAMR